LIHPVWSATTCDFPGAGLYIGLAPRHEHLIIARMCTPRQVRLITAGNIRLGENGAACPLEYYAVRDPSVVRVIPVSLPALPNGFRHVKLAFQFEKPQLLQDAVSMGQLDGRDIWAFVLTVGLPIATEDSFYRRAIGNYPSQSFTDLYARARELGCSETDL
jgi:hypothetical protein